MDCNFNQSEKEKTKSSRKSRIEIWKSTSFDGKPMISIVDYRDGSMTDYVLQRKAKLPKGEPFSYKGEMMYPEYIDTDEFLGRNGFNRMRTLEDVLG
jgi:hypothetical protein